MWLHAHKIPKQAKLSYVLNWKSCCLGAESEEVWGREQGLTAMSIDFILGVMNFFKIDCGDGCKL